MFKSRKIIKDVVHETISINEQFIIDLINTKEFIRLHNIRQLSLLYYVFPNATYSRYVHSLGTYELARRFIEKTNKLFPNKISKYDEKLIMVSALLHDIGHGAFSHSFEFIFGTTHEDYSKEIISNKNFGISRILLKNKISPNDVISVLNGKYKNKYVNQLISSQLDFDRLDYLVRDAHHAGASCGKVEISLLIEWMDIFNGEIVFNKKAIHVIEQVLFSRHLMNVSVYEQTRVEVLENLLKLIFLRLNYLVNNKKPLVDHFNTYYLFNSWFSKKKFCIDDYLTIDDDIIFTLLKGLKYEKDDYLIMAYNVFLEIIKGKNIKTASFSPNKYRSLINEYKDKYKYPEIYIHRVYFNKKIVYDKNSKKSKICINCDKKIKLIHECSDLLKRIKIDPTELIAIIE